MTNFINFNRPFFIVLITTAGCMPSLKPSYQTTEIKSKQFPDKLFIKTKNWGLTGDSKITTISSTDNIDFNKKQSDTYYIIEGLDPFFYKQSNDNLILYSMTRITVPKNFKTKWKIILNQVDNPTFTSLYKDKGYSRP